MRYRPLNPCLNPVALHLLQACTAATSRSATQQQGLQVLDVVPASSVSVLDPERSPVSSGARPWQRGRLPCAQFRQGAKCCM